MLVEDDKFLREMLAGKLIAQGLDVKTGVDGKNALDVLKDFTPEIIILDLLLPDIDGFGVLENVKKDPRLASVPVIILSNLDKAEDMQKAHTLGAKEFMVKSNFSINEIINKAKEILGV